MSLAVMLAMAPLCRLDRRPCLQRPGRWRAALLEHRDDRIGGQVRRRCAQSPRAPGWTASAAPNVSPAPTAETPVTTRRGTLARTRSSRRVVEQVALRAERDEHDRPWPGVTAQLGRLARTGPPAPRPGPPCSPRSHRPASRRSHLVVAPARRAAARARPRPRRGVAAIPGSACTVRPGSTSSRIEPLERRRGHLVGDRRDEGDVRALDLAQPLGAVSAPRAPRSTSTRTPSRSSCR